LFVFSMCHHACVFHLLPEANLKLRDVLISMSPLHTSTPMESDKRVHPVGVISRRIVQSHIDRTLSFIRSKCRHACTL